MKRTTKYVAFDVHQATTVASVRGDSGRVLARSVLETHGPSIVEFGRTQAAAIVALRPEVDSVPQELLASPQSFHIGPALSPDGRWLAYVSNETGARQVYVKPFPNVDGGRWQISTNGGDQPLWAHSGNELFYKNAQQELVAVAISTTPTFTQEEHTPLFTLPPGIPLPNTATYSIGLDDQRFLMLRVANLQDATRGRELMVVENWFEELKAKVGN